MVHQRKTLELYLHERGRRVERKNSRQTAEMSLNSFISWKWGLRKSNTDMAAKVILLVGSISCKVNEVGFNALFFVY